MTKHRLKQVFDAKSKHQEMQSLETKKINEGWLECKTLGCNGKPQITDDTTGEIICGSCGSILAERSVDINSEKAGDFEEFLAKSRTGPEQSLSMYDMGMMTVISDKDAMGKHLSDSMKNTFGRLKRLNSRSRTRSSNRTLRFALLFLHSLKTKLGLPDSVAENAAYIYRKAMQKKITVGRSAKALMCASIYAACRQNDIPRSIADVSQRANMNKKEISRAYRVLIGELDMNLSHYTASEFVAKIANESKISEKTKRDSLELLQQLTKKDYPMARIRWFLPLRSCTCHVCLMENTRRRARLQKHLG